MDYLYENGVQHRDLKAANCLLDAHCHVKLADFGLARRSGRKEDKQDAEETDGAAGTPTHMAPELLLTNSNRLFCQESDVYSYAIVMYEVLSRKAAFEGLNESQIIAQINAQQRPSPIPTDSPPELITLMKECWAHDTAMRQNFKGIVSDLQDAAEAMKKRPKQGQSVLPLIFHARADDVIRSFVSGASHR